MNPQEGNSGITLDARVIHVSGCPGDDAANNHGAVNNHDAAHNHDTGVLEEWRTKRLENRIVMKLRRPGPMNSSEP
jgi:hypothetical protein